MKTTLYSLILTVAIAGSAFAQTTTQPTDAERAAAAVPVLQSRMLDPDSFRLDHVLVAPRIEKRCMDKWCRHHDKVPVDVLCFEFRSHNTMGGYSEGRAIIVLDGVQIIDQDFADPSYARYPGYDIGGGWGVPARCDAKHITQDITSDVSKLLKAAPKQP